MVKIRKEGRTWLYSINEDSPLVKRLEDFDNSLIESMIGPEEFDKIQNEDGKRILKISFKVCRARKKKIIFRHDTSEDIVPCVASRPGKYLKEKVTVKR